jgi:hypothetical protein
MLMRPLGSGDNPAVLIENDETRAGRALVEGSDISGHNLSPANGEHEVVLSATSSHFRRWILR